MLRRKRYYSFISFAIFVLSLQGVLLYSQDNIVNVVKVSPSDTIVAHINDVFKIEIKIQNVTGLHIIHTELGFDPAYLKLISTEEGPFLSSEGQVTFFYPVVDSTAGTIITDHSILGAFFISGSGTQMKMLFRALKEGSTNITLSNVQMRDVDNADISPVNVENGSVQIGTSAVRDRKKAVSLPETIILYKNYPNPFNPSTHINYELLRDGLVKFQVYDLKGRVILTLVDEYQRKGQHQVCWNGHGHFGNTVHSGIYIFRIQSGTFCTSEKGLLMK